MRIEEEKKEYFPKIEHNNLRPNSHTLTMTTTSVHLHDIVHGPQLCQLPATVIVNKALAA